MLWKPLRGGTSRELFGLWVLSSMVSLFPPLCLHLLLPHHLHKWALDFSICSFPQRTQNQRPVDPKPLNPNQPIHKLFISNICYSSRKLTQKEQLLYRRHGGLESIYQESMNDHRNEQFCYWIFLNLKKQCIKVQDECGWKRNNRTKNQDFSSNATQRASRPPWRTPRQRVHTGT